MISDTDEVENTPHDFKNTCLLTNQKRHKSNYVNIFTHWGLTIVLLQILCLKYIEIYNYFPKTYIYTRYECTILISYSTHTGQWLKPDA